MKLIKLDQFRKDYFAEGSRPALKTIRRQIKSGEIPGKKIGKVYYVDMDKFNLTGNPLVDSVLLAS